jgi:hypothetical protein
MELSSKEDVEQCKKGMLNIVSIYYATYKN